MEITDSNPYPLYPAKIGVHHLAEASLPMRTTNRGSNEIERTSSSTEKFVVEEIANIDLLPRFKKTLFSEMHISEAMKQIICPVLIDDNRFLIFCQRADAGTDLIQDIHQRLVQHRYIAEPPGCVFVTRQILLSLARGSAQGMMQLGRSPRAESNAATWSNKEASALYQLFEQIVEFAVNYRASDIHFNLNLEEALGLAAIVC